MRGLGFFSLCTLALSVGCTKARERPGEPIVPGASRIHEAGILDPESPDFHGVLLKSLNWDFALCAKCHGDDFQGGTSQTSCTSCHAEGPTACVTCHGTVPKSGAHELHVKGGLLDRKTGCETCHVVPERYTDVGHIFDARGEIDPAPAEVILSGFDANDKSCATSCHGADFVDANAQNPRPVWETPALPVACDSCHGMPPSNHGSSVCKNCHAHTDDERRLTDLSLHLNGHVEIGKNESECSSCHGSANNPAPPPDFDGEFSPSSIGVGAHKIHLESPRRLRGPMECADCHLVPETVTSPGHIDSELPAEVFPFWNRDTRKCSNVDCHGGGETPEWTNIGSGEVHCGSCHGIPPSDGNHHALLSVFDCHTCHQSSVDAFGNTIFDIQNGVMESKHINGRVDF